MKQTRRASRDLWSFHSHSSCSVGHREPDFQKEKLQAEGRDAIATDLNNARNADDDICGFVIADSIVFDHA